jgi:branched-chain amino acid transport system substrate-binding protein
LRAGAMLLGLSLVGVACGGDDSTEETTDTTPAAECTEFPYALALQFPETGDAGGLGAPMLKGAQLAIDEFNAANPDMCVEIVKLDTQGDPAKAPAAAQSAIDNAKILGIMGPGFSGETEAAMPLYEAAGLAVVTGSATRPSLSANGWKSFHRLLANDSVQGPAIGKYITEELKATAVAVIDDASSYGKPLADEVATTVGSAVTVRDAIDPKGTDYSAVVTKIKDANVTAVFFGGYYAEAAKISTQLRDAGVEATLVFGDGVKDQAGYADAAGPAAAGAIIACPCKDGEGDLLKAWQAKYNGETPSTYGAEYYDVANVFLNIIKAGATTREAVLAAVETYEGEGVTKKIKFQENGEATEAGTIFFYEVKDGKITYLTSIL